MTKNSEAQPLVSLKNVTKIFKTSHGPKTVLEDVSFDVNPGEVVCLLGPSGGGKSTCLRTINILETISAGSIVVDGEDLSKSRKPIHELRRPTAMIFQRFELFQHLTAIENVSLPLKLVLRWPEDKANQAALDLLARVGLADHGHKFPRALSGGQSQRVAIARALALNPKCLLCDEPTSALDPELVDEVVDLLTSIAKQGMTMIIVTHEVRFAAQVATRCLFLDAGRIVEAGDAREFFEAPQTARLQHFLKRTVK